MFNEGSITLKTDFAEVSRRIKTSLRREGAVVISKGKCSRVRRIPHLPFPVERTQRIITGWFNVPRSTRLRISDVERERRRNSGDSKVSPRSAGKLKLIHDRSVLQGNGNCVVCDFHGVIGDLQKPEKPIRQDSRIEIVQLGRQTDVPEVQSYQDERGVPLGGGRSSPWVGGDAANVLTLIDPDVGDYRILVALVVGRGAERVSHGYLALEVGDDIGFRVLAVKERPNAGPENVP